MTTPIYDALFFRRLLEECEGDARKATIVAVERRDEDAVRVIATADRTYHLEGTTAIEVAVEVGVDPFAVADTINDLIQAEREDCEQELAGIRSLKGRL